MIKFIIPSLVVASVFITSIGVAAEATTWTLKPDESPVTFVATGKPGFLKIRGEGARAEGVATIEGGKLTGAFDVSVASFKTGINLRDEHMHGKYLESEKFKTAHLVIDPLSVDSGNGEKDYDFTGKLTLKGVEKPIAGKLTLALADASAKGKASFEVKLSDFPVGVPSHLGVSVAETVQVDVQLIAEKRLNIATQP